VSTPKVKKAWSEPSLQEKAKLAFSSKHQFRLMLAHVSGLRLLTMEKHPDLGFCHPHQGDHEWLDDAANYPYITVQSDCLLFWDKPEGDSIPWEPDNNINQALFVKSALDVLPETIST
jgi:hypothetical protein